MNLARAASIPALWLVFALGGCSGQTEGQRCDPLVAGDCQDPLVCTTFPGSGITYGVCCPNGTSSSYPACNPGISTPDAGADTGTGPSEDAAADVSVDAAPDVAAEASTEPGDETSS